MLDNENAYSTNKKTPWKYIRSYTCDLLINNVWIVATRKICIVWILWWIILCIKESFTHIGVGRRTIINNRFHWITVNSSSFCNKLKNENKNGKFNYLKIFGRKKTFSLFNQTKTRTKINKIQTVGISKIVLVFLFLPNEILWSSTSKTWSAHCLLNFAWTKHLSPVKPEHPN